MFPGNTLRLLARIAVGPFTAALTLSTPNAVADDGVTFFENKVCPLLAKQCLVCHSAASNPVMGGLRLDSREALVKGGARGPAIVGGKPEQSLLLRAVRHTESNLRMPPGPKLKDADIAVLAKWIEMGAPWGRQPAPAPVGEKFWAFVPPGNPTVPKVKNPAWVKSPVDAFILAALQAKGLTPMRPANKRALIRRATFDLTGLPPAPAEVSAFLDDQAPDAFARVVDRLLASPHYGERWGRHWLDVARYADSNGLDENLVYKNAFRYRDYVIQAFNKDKPYDQFVQEQLAGDLLPPVDDLPTTFERWTATGFLALGAKMLAEDDPVKMEMDIVDEQLDTTARAFMGLTVGCARCHDHKFDPIPQADYYSMAGIFKSSKTMENFKVVAKWHEYVLAPKEDRDRLKAHEAKLEAKRKEIGRISKAENEKLEAAARQKAGSYLLAAHDVEQSGKIHLKPILTAEQSQASSKAIVRPADSFDDGNAPRQLEKKGLNIPKDVKGPYFAEYKVTVDTAGDYQIDLLGEERNRNNAALWVNGVLDNRSTEPVENRQASADSGGWNAVGIFSLTAGQNTIRLEHPARFPYFEKLLIAPNPLSAGMPVPKTTAQIARRYMVNPSFLDQVGDHLRRSQKAPASVLLAWDLFGTGKGLREWTSPAANLFKDFLPANREALAARYHELFQEAVRQWQALPAESKDAARKNVDDKHPGLSDPGLEALRQLLYEKNGPFQAPDDAGDFYPAETRWELARLEKERQELEAARPEFARAMGVIENGKIADLALHIRGSHWTLGAVAPRGFLRVIAGENQQPLGTESSGRLKLAQWLTREDHPLTSRVMVNRIWRWHFGRGLVPTVDNFGRLGEKPVNQALLDWLALRFIEGGWSVKSMQRVIMLSNTYQMASHYDERSAEIDPENNLLWRMNRRRLEAEEIRDAIMTVSGGLDLTPGGSIMTYKDRGYVADTSRRGDLDYDRNLRAVYIPVIRSSMYDVFRAFDLPDPSTPNGDRDSTVVAPQALFMMNGSVLLKHSRKLAESLLARPNLDDAGRIRDAYQRALGRPPAAREIDQALTMLARVESLWPDRQKDAGERRTLAWQSFCKALLGANEFIYVD